MKDAIALLHEQHRHIIEQFALFEGVRDDANSECKQSIVDDACDALELHNRIAEELFYPALGTRGDSLRLVDEARVKHAVARHLVGELRAMDPDDRRYDATFTVLGQYVRYQVEMESSRIVPEARRAAVDLEKLGARMLRRLQELSLGPRGNGSASSTGGLALSPG
jgi:hypothetical protein